MQGIKEVPELRGIIPNAFEQIFSYINQAGTSAQFLVRASYLEIYNEDIRDLLKPNATKLEVKERPDVGVYVKDLSTFVVKDVNEMDKLMDVGNANRSVGFTEMNAQSSRSHSIFSITIEVSEKGADGEDHLRAGKLHLVDLAGSERQSKTGATGDRLKEATKINLSLSALGNVISSLVDGKSSHIPYRDSKLTRLLQDSLGGNAKTLMVATMSPASYNYDESISTLRYANRAKNIKNKPKVNEDPKDAMLREFQEEIKRLKKMLDDGGDPGEEVHEVEEIEEVEEVEEIEESDEEVTDVDKPLSRKSSVKQEPLPKKKSKKKAPKNADTVDASAVSKAQLEAMQELVNKEKQAIIASKDIEESEKNKLLAEKEVRAQELEREQNAREELAKKLLQLEQKLLVGGVNILDQHEEQKMMLARRAQELEERARKERELQREVEEHDEANLQIEEEFTNLQEEANAKTRKIKKLWSMISDQHSELKDLEEEMQREREGLLETIRELTSELKLRTLIINGFVPQTEYQIIEDCSEWDEAAEKWRIAHVAHGGNNIRGKRALVSGTVLQGLHRNHDQDEPNWDPMCAFPNAYLTYDVPSLKKKEAKRVPRAKAGSAAKKGSKASLMQSEVSLNQQNTSSKTNLLAKPVVEAAPVARGLVGKTKHYA